MNCDCMIVPIYECNRIYNFNLSNKLVLTQTKQTNKSSRINKGKYGHSSTEYNAQRIFASQGIMIIEVIVCVMVLMCIIFTCICIVSGIGITSIFKEFTHKNNADE